MAARHGPVGVAGRSVISRKLVGVALALAWAPPFFGAAAFAQNAYYNKPENALGARVSEWVGVYWSRVDAAGTPAAGAGAATFAGLVPNADLFNPARAVRWTLEDLKVLSAGDCDGMENWAATGLDGTVGTPQAAVVAAFRDAMQLGKFSTGISTNPEGTLEHAVLILAAPPGEGVVAYQAGDELVSLNLPLKTASGLAYAAALELNVSPESQLVLATMIASSQGWATATADRAVEAASLVTGAQSKADRFTEIVGTYLTLAGVQGRAATKLHAHFGRFGQLPLVQANLRDCMVLIDPLNGNIAGPFKLDSALDARGLLGLYPDAYVAGSAVRYSGSGGCGRTIAGGWRSSPPCPWWLPLCSYTPTWPTGTWQCSEFGIGAGGNVACVCEYRGTGSRNGTPPSVPMRLVCTCSAGGSVCNSSQPGVGSPPAAPSCGEGAAAPTCVTEYFW